MLLSDQNEWINEYDRFIDRVYELIEEIEELKTRVVDNIKGGS